MNLLSNYEYHGQYFSELPLIFHYDVVGKNFCKNWHKNIEILYFVKGRGQVEAGPEAFDAFPGRLAVINSNISHGIFSDETIEYYCLIPDNDFFKVFGINTADTAYTPVIDDKKAAELFENVVSAFSSIDIYRSASVIVSAAELILYLSKNYSSAPDTYKSGGRETGITLAIGYILANINKSLTADELSEQAGMSKYYFIREFKKATGSSPIEFIHKNRCATAKKMFASGNYSISEVSEKTGFESTSYFSKIFKRYVGITPKEFIKNLHSK